MVVCVKQSIMFYRNVSLLEIDILGNLRLSFLYVRIFLEWPVYSHIQMKHFISVILKLRLDSSDPELRRIF